MYDLKSTSKVFVHLSFMTVTQVQKFGWGQRKAGKLRVTKNIWRNTLHQVNWQHVWV